MDASAKADAQPAAFVPRADLVGVCTSVDRPPIVVDVPVVLPHNPDVPGEPVPAGMAANEAVAGKREKYGVNHILTTGFQVAALERFGCVHPETIRLARTLGAIHASRQAPLMEDNIVVRAPKQNGLEARGASSSMASRILTRMSVALQWSNAIILPARCQRERTSPPSGTVASGRNPCRRSRLLARKREGPCRATRMWQRRSPPRCGGRGLGVAAGHGVWEGWWAVLDAGTCPGG